MTDTITRQNAVSTSYIGNNQNLGSISTESQGVIRQSPAAAVLSQQLTPREVINPRMALVERAEQAFANVRNQNPMQNEDFMEALGHIDSANPVGESKKPNKAFELAERVINDLQSAKDLLATDRSDLPVNSQEFKEMHGAMINRLNATFDKVHDMDYGRGLADSDAASFKDEISQTIEELLAQIDHEEEHEIMSDSHSHATPASPQKIASFKRTQYENAIEMLKKPEFAGVSQATKQALVAKIRDAEERLYSASFGGSDALDKKGIRNLMGKKTLSSLNIGDMMAKNAVAKLGKNGADIPVANKRLNDKAIIAEYFSAFIKANDGISIKPSKIEKAFQQNYSEFFNHQEWKPINNKITAQYNGRTVSMNSQLTPAGQFANLKDSYQQDGLRGVSSGSTKETRHAANLWASKLTDNNGQVVFQGYRHATFDPFKVANGQERLAGAVNRARESVAMMVQDQLGQDPNMIRQLQLRGHEPLKVQVISTNLESASFWQYAKGDSEFHQVKNQTKAWNELAKTPQNIIIKDKHGNDQQVKVQIEVVAFNVPVNAAAFKKIAGVQGTSNNMNGQSLQALLGDMRSNRPIESQDSEVGRLVAKINQKLSETFDPKTRADLTQHRETLIKLGIQIRNIVHEGAQHSGNNEPYKLASRLIALGSEISLTRKSLGEMALTGSFYNCKSGKDRTSQADSEAKEIATQARYDVVRDYREPRTETEKQNLKNFVKNNGNFEVQERNVGAAGYKLFGVDGLLNQIGEQKSSAFQYWGLSQYAKS